MLSDRSIITNTDRHSLLRGNSQRWRQRNIPKQTTTQWSSGTRRREAEPYLDRRCGRRARGLPLARWGTCLVASPTPPQEPRKLGRYSAAEQRKRRHGVPPRSARTAPGCGRRLVCLASSGEGHIPGVDRVGRLRWWVAPAAGLAGPPNIRDRRRWRHCDGEN